MSLSLRSLFSNVVDNLDSHLASVDLRAKLIKNRAKIKYASEYIKDLCKELEDAGMTPLKNTKRVIGIIEGDITNG